MATCDEVTDDDGVPSTGPRVRIFSAWISVLQTIRGTATLPGGASTTSTAVMSRERARPGSGTWLAILRVAGAPAGRTLPSFR